MYSEALVHCFLKQFVVVFEENDDFGLNYYFLCNTLNRHLEILAACRLLSLLWPSFLLLLFQFQTAKN